MRFRRASPPGPEPRRFNTTRLPGALIVLGLLLWGAPPARAQLGQVETERLRFVFFEGTQSFLVPHVARASINSLAFQRRLFGFDPDGEVTVLLADFSDSGNAGATVVPRNAVTVQIAPLSVAFETIAPNERMTTIMNHELVHIATMDQATGRDRAFRRLFGGKVAPVAEQPETILYLYLTAPRVAAPRWYHEGIAVFVDTWMAGGLGRAQGGYDEMVFRSMVRDETPFYDPLGLVSEGTKVDFQLQINSYLYGTRFMTYLARRYSPDKLVAWVSRREGSRGYYSRHFQQVFGTSLESAWQDWIEAERAFQRANLEAIRRYPITQARDLSSQALGSVSRAFYEPATRRIHAAFNYPGVVAHIGSIPVDGGSVERLVDVKDPSVYTVTSTAFDPDTRTMFYTTDNGAHRDLVALDLTSRRTRVLIKDGRIGDLAWNAADRSLWGVRHLNGLSTLVRIPPPHTEWNQVATLPFGLVMYDLDVSPDGSRLSASFGEINGRQDVRVLDTARVSAGDLTPVARFDFGPAVPNGFVFSPDGRYLYGSSYYSGASNIFRYEIANGTLDAVTNAETGFVRPLPLGGDDLIAFRYSGQGFVPVRFQATPLEDVSAITFLGERVIEEHPELKGWAVGSPAAVPFDDLPKKTGTYRLGGGLGLESFYPIVQGYKDTAAVGVRVNFSDPLQLNRASLMASYSPAGNLGAGERVHLKAQYERFDWRARAELNNGDFYDLFGPTKRGRKGYLFGLGHRRTLIYDEPRRMDLDVGGSFSGNLDRLPQYQNVEVDVDTLLSVAARLTSSDVRSSLGHVDDEKGVKWSAVAEGDYVNDQFFARVHGTFDIGLWMPAGHSSLWLRSAAGASPGDAAEPFANFYFGAFGNNYVDRGEEKRYRDYDSLPGAELNEVSGRNFVKTMLEWNLPPWRFRRLGTPGAFLTWARPAVFVGGLATNLDAPGIRRTVMDAGAQVDFRFTVLSALDMTLSAGGGLAFEDGYAPRRELMVSLKVLR